MKDIFSECDCNEKGSKNITCNQTSGACTCKSGWIGDKCQGNLNLLQKSTSMQKERTLIIHHYSYCVSF